MATLDFGGQNIILAGAEEFNFLFDSNKIPMEVEENIGGAELHQTPGNARFPHLYYSSLYRTFIWSWPYSCSYWKLLL